MANHNSLIIDKNNQKDNNILLSQDRAAAQNKKRGNIANSEIRKSAKAQINYRK